VGNHFGVALSEFGTKLNRRYFQSKAVQNGRDLGVRAELKPVGTFVTEVPDSVGATV